jgi:hypothetical protein
MMNRKPRMELCVFSTQFFIHFLWSYFHGKYRSASKISRKYIVQRSNSQIRLQIVCLLSHIGHDGKLVWKWKGRGRKILPESARVTRNRIAEEVRWEGILLLALKLNIFVYTNCLGIGLSLSSLSLSQFLSFRTWIHLPRKKFGRERERERLQNLN